MLNRSCAITSYSGDYRQDGLVRVILPLAAHPCDAALATLLHPDFKQGEDLIVPPQDLGYGH